MTSIIKCTFKTSYSITKKLIKYGSVPCVIIGMLIILFYELWLIRDTISILCNLCFDHLIFVGNTIASIINFIPWFVWIVIAIPVFIIGYSYGICVIRKYPDGNFAEFTAVSINDIHEFLVPYCTFWGGILGIIIGLVLAELWYIPISLYDKIMVSACCSIGLAMVGLFLGGSLGFIILANIHIADEKEKIR